VANVSQALKCSFEQLCCLRWVQAKEAIQNVTESILGGAKEKGQEAKERTGSAAENIQAKGQQGWESAKGQAGRSAAQEWVRP